MPEFLLLKVFVVGSLAVLYFLVAGGHLSGWRKRIPAYIEAKKRQGFTLIEISIVLVIIGLIVGAIFVGQDLIETATLRKWFRNRRNYKQQL